MFFTYYVIRTENRDSLVRRLNYSKSLLFYPAYAYLGQKFIGFPGAYANQTCIFSLPMYPEICEEQGRFIPETIAVFYPQ